MGRRRSLTVLRRLGLATAILLTLLLVSFAVPVRTWRTGEQARPPLDFDPAARPLLAPSRIWIDTDAACGHAPRTDPDDCFALLVLAGANGVEIAGVSSIFGNASLDVTDRVTRELAGLLFASQNGPPVYRGAAAPLQHGSIPSTDASKALQTQLAKRPLGIVALGPLTNVATALEQRPDLQRNVSALIVVMGRRTGHLFHPGEGAGSGVLFGHGPVFRDFNFAMDMDAAKRILRMDLPLVLVPYVAARDVELTAADLDQLSARGGPRSWIAERSRDWLAYWQQDVGRNGFYPFDAVAAAFVRSPGQFRCAEVTAWVGDDPTMFIPFWNPPALMVTQSREEVTDARAVGRARFCLPRASGFERPLKRALMGPE